MLTRRPKGCYECSRRRIICDKTEPECRKCQRKGIKCSGQGVRYRFSLGVASRCRLNDRQMPPVQSMPDLDPLEHTQASQVLARSPPKTLKWKNVPFPLRKKHKSSQAQIDLLADTIVSITQPGNNLPSYDVIYIEDGSPSTPDASSRVDSRGITMTSRLDASDYRGIVPIWHMPVHRTLHILDPQTRLLFSHFSAAIAPVMVVWDGEFNGYRNVILPLAIQDKTLHRVVCVIAAHHLAADIPDLQRPAQAGQAAIISKLRQESFELESPELFSYTTWATVLLLLVGETITGGDDFIYLLEMLMFLANTSAHRKDMPQEMHQFLLQQTKMFQLFGFPMSHELKGIKTLERTTEYYLDFMLCPVTSDLITYRNMNLMKAAINDACSLYRRRAQSSLSAEESVFLIEEICHKVADIDHLTEGAHALVWTYFIAAAESTLQRHRQFFIDRLQNLYRRTKFRSIPIALNNLDRLWATQGHQRWTESLVYERPILVM